MDFEKNNAEHKIVIETIRSDEETVPDLDMGWSTTVKAVSVTPEPQSGDQAVVTRIIRFSSYL
jgi:hypothetical protein